MILTLVTVTAGIAIAQPATLAAPVAASARTLATLPNVAVSYYDVAGRTGPAIEKNLKQMMADPKLVTSMKPYEWKVGAALTKRTEGDKCSVIAVKTTLSSTVHLPRLAEQARAPAAVMTSWNSYVTGLQSDAAANLWFVSDHLPAIQRSLANLTCDKANGAWTASIDQLKAQQLEYAKQRAATAAAQAKAAKKRGSAPEIQISDY